MDITLPPEDHIQEDGTVLLLDHTINHGGKWRVHMSDADNWPSNFHAHDLEGAGEKLDLYTGNVYDIPTKQHKRKLKKKVMRYIYNQELRSSNNSVIAAKCTERASFDYLA